MKVVHLTTLHPPDDVRIWLKECRTLAASGYEVALLARVATTSDEAGVDVRPIGVTTARSGTPALTRRLRRALRAARREHAALYHLHDPELLPVGLALKLTGARVVYDAHEDTPREIFELDPSRRLRSRVLSRTWTIANAVAGLALDGVVAASPAIARTFPARKTVVVRNFPLRDELTPGVVPQADRPPEIVYVGGLTTGRGIPKLVEAMSDVRTEGATLVLAGAFHRDEPSLAASLERLPGWQRVRYEGSLTRARMGETLARARAGVVLFQPAASYFEAMPNKLFEYMAAGLPVVASDFPLWRGIVEREGCGVVVDPTDPRAIARAVDRLLNDPEEADAMGRRARAAFERQYNWDAEAESLRVLYRTLLGR